MIARQVLLGGMVAAGLAVSGVSVSAALLDMPQDAVPVADPVGDALRDRAPVAQPAAPQQAPQTTTHQDPSQVQAPATVPVTNEIVQEEVPDDVLAEEEAGEEVAEQAAPAQEEGTPGVRRRLPIAIIQAIDKTTAETMRFEVEVGGRPVRFSRSLIFKVRACEVSGPDELTEDSIAYLEIGTQPRSQANTNEARQVFKGWMFASSPSVSSLQHPNYDAWVIGCKAR